ncbi:MAG TPA: hypothetical protein VEL71_05030 [Candidatus Dormibacteraeota bacterium]|nr:hypothetical protein [Candidatus Dormibacteraeota bacterium]
MPEFQIVLQIGKPKPDLCWRTNSELDFDKISITSFRVEREYVWLAK